jgi:hypothetical protein
MYQAAQHELIHSEPMLDSVRVNSATRMQSAHPGARFEAAGNGVLVRAGRSGAKHFDEQVEGLFWLARAKERAHKNVVRPRG